MTLVVEAPEDREVRGLSPQARAWAAAEAESAAAMGTVNAAVARLVAAVRDLVAADGWQGWGIQSPEHWLCWKANVSRARAEGLVRVARRVDELPECWALFASGRLGEDAMVRIARCRRSPSPTLVRRGSRNARSRRGSVVTAGCAGGSVFRPTKARRCRTG
jgi:hypothetical protein